MHPAPAPGPARPSLPGLVVGALIGRGRVGSVWLAETAQGEPVAVKVVPAEGLNAERFLREARILGGLRHPRIVRCRTAGRTDDSLYLVMDVAASDLRRRLAQGPLPEAEALRLMDQVAEGLGELAGHGVVHRDLSPGNLLLDADGNALIGDFGLASSADPALTRTGEILGTVAYLSPEQARGEEADARSDLYSLGAVMYHAVTGKAPVVAGNAWAMIATIAAGPDHDPHRDAPQLSVQMRAVLRCCLAADPAQRYPDAGTLRDDLASLARGEGPRRAGGLRVVDVAAEPPAALPLRRWSLFAAAGLVGLVCGGAAGVALRRHEASVRTASAAFSAALAANSPASWQELAAAGGDPSETRVAQAMAGLWRQVPAVHEDRRQRLAGELAMARSRIAEEAAARVPEAALKPAAMATPPATRPVPPPVASVAPKPAVPVPAAAAPALASAVRALPVPAPPAPEADPAPVVAMRVDTVPLGPSASSVVACLAHPTDRLQAIAHGPGSLFRTADGGSTWQRIDIDPGAYPGMERGSWSTERNEVFLSAQGEGIVGLLSRNGSQSFAAIRGPRAEAGANFGWSQQLADGRILCAMRGPFVNPRPPDRLYASADRGATWTPVASLVERWDDRALPTPDGMFAVCRDPRLGWTTDLGATVHRFPGDASWSDPIIWSESDRLTMLLAGRNSTHVIGTLRFGEAEIAGRRVPEGAWASASIRAFAIDPREPRRWFGLDEETGLWLSRDAGATWREFITRAANGSGFRQVMAFAAGAPTRLLIANGSAVVRVEVVP